MKEFLTITQRTTFFSLHVIRVVRVRVVRVVTVIVGRRAAASIIVAGLGKVGGGLALALEDKEGDGANDEEETNNNGNDDTGDLAAREVVITGGGTSGARDQGGRGGLTDSGERGLVGGESSVDIGEGLGR